MISFKEFLESQGRRLRDEAATMEHRKEEWVASVESLIRRMEAWLKESDPGGLLRLQTRPVERSEEAIGPYGTSSLDIRLGGRVVAVDPVGCDIMGPVWKPEDGYWSGRVDLVSPPYKFELYKFTGANGSGEWYIRNTSDYAIVPLEKEAFDRALLELFS